MYFRHYIHIVIAEAVRNVGDAGSSGVFQGAVRRVEQPQRSMLCTALALWVLIATRTLRGAWHGYLFVSPCLVPGSIPQDSAFEEI